MTATDITINMSLLDTGKGQCQVLESRMEKQIVDDKVEKMDIMVSFMDENNSQLPVVFLFYSLSQIKMQFFI